MARPNFDIKIVVDNTPKAKRELKSKTRKIYKAWGLYIAGKWKELISKKKIVDTGRYLNSPTFKEDDKGVTVGSAVKYATFLELGTSKMKARPTLKPAIMENKKNLEKIAKNILEK